MGFSSRRNQTSAWAGCFSAALQLNFRLFFNQDMEISCGASYLTIEKKQNTLCMMSFLHLFTILYILLYFAYSNITAKTKPAVSVFSVNLLFKNDSSVIKSPMCLSEMRSASGTCVPKYNRPPCWLAAGVSYVSFHPNVNWTIFNKQFLADLRGGLLNAPKFFFTMDEYVELSVQWKWQKPRHLTCPQRMTEGAYWSIYIQFPPYVSLKLL